MLDEEQVSKAGELPQSEDVVRQRGRVSLSRRPGQCELLSEHRPSEETQARAEETGDLSALLAAVRVRDRADVIDFLLGGV